MSDVHQDGGTGLQLNNPTAQLRQVLRKMALERFLGLRVSVGVSKKAGQDCWGISELEKEKRKKKNMYTGVLQGIPYR